MKEPPLHIITQINLKSENSSDTAHRRFDAEAKATTFTIGQLNMEYITKHKMLRRQMYQAAFTNIEDEITSESFTVKGLEINTA